MTSLAIDLERGYRNHSQLQEVAFSTTKLVDQFSTGRPNIWSMQGGPIFQILSTRTLANQNNCPFNKKTALNTILKPIIIIATLHFS